MKHKKLSVLEDDTQLVVVYDGPRGLPGPPGDPGIDGADGRSLTPRGVWNSNLQYESGDSVEHRSRVNPGVTSLWIAKEGPPPTVGKAPFEEPERWMEIGAGGTATSNVLQVYQYQHPFTKIGQPVTFFMRTGRWELASVGQPDMLAVGVVADIFDHDNFTIQFDGQLAGVDPLLLFDPASPAGRGLLDWTPGRVYYLSDVAGMYQEAHTQRNGFAIQPMIIPTALAADGTATVNILTWGPDGTTPDTHAGVAPPQHPMPGDLWYRTDKFQGLYVYLSLADGGPVWVQTNG